MKTEDSEYARPALMKCAQILLPERLAAGQKPETGLTKQNGDEFGVRTGTSGDRRGV